MINRYGTQHLASVRVRSSWWSDSYCVNCGVGAHPQAVGTLLGKPDEWSLLPRVPVMTNGDENELE